MQSEYEYILVVDGLPIGSFTDHKDEFGRLHDGQKLAEYALSRLNKGFILKKKI